MKHSFLTLFKQWEQKNKRATKRLKEAERKWNNAADAYKKQLAHNNRIHNAGKSIPLASQKREDRLGNEIDRREELYNRAEAHWEDVQDESRAFKKMR